MKSGLTRNTKTDATNAEELGKAVEEAVETCIQKGILTDLLLGNKAEVTNMILQEYDEDLHISNEKEISYNEGMEAGIEAGLRQAEARILEEKQRADVLTLLLQKKSENEIARILELPLEKVQAVIRTAQLSEES